MAAESPKKKLPFLVCQSCAGTGTKDGMTCPACKGLGVVLFFKNKILYWGKIVDTWNIYNEKFEKFIKTLINVTLIIYGLSGFALILWSLYEQNFETAFSFDYWFKDADFVKLYFWLTVLADLYLYYRIEQELDPKHKVLKKEFRDENLIYVSSVSDWQDVTTRPKTDLIDVSKSFTDPAADLVNDAWLLAKQKGESEVVDLHLFHQLPENDQGLIILGRLGLPKQLIQDKIDNILSQKTAVGGRPALLPIAKKILIMAYWQAMLADKFKVGVAEIAAAFTQKEIFSDLEKDYIGEILLDLELSRQKFFNVIVWLRIQNQLRSQVSRYRARGRLKPKSGIDRAMTAVATPFLDQLSVDLTAAARAGALFPAVGREKEFENIFRIIEGSRDSVILIGYPGVGKTSVLEGLAQKMIADDVPEILQDKRLVSLSVPRIVSGATPAQAEERLMSAMAEAARSKNIVLAIENIHDMIGITAGQEAGLDLSEVLTQILEKKPFYVVATTTPSEYSKSVEQSSLANVFQNIKVEEPAIDEAIQILEAKSGPIEYRNKVFFSYDSLDKAVALSSRYMHDKYLPQKALEIIEQVSIAVRKEKGENQIVSGDDVAKFISEKTAIPVAKITEKEAAKLLNLEDEIHRRIIGQEEAVKMVASSLKRARAELREGDRPIASLLFLGPTGVGKTELAKTVADIYFGSEENMVRLDMSEYQTPESIYRLIGAPTGSREGGYLTEAVRKNPFTVLLIDELEKAHPDVLNLFLQVMEDGRLTDNQGRTIDFTNLIIIMTSNAGTAFIQDEVAKNTPLEEIKNHLINEQLREYFRPEFLNRYDGIMVFKPLSQEDVYQIAKLMMAKVAKRLENKGITFTATDAAVRELAQKGYDPKFGARPLRRVIQTEVDDALANYLLTAQIGRRDAVTLDAGGKISVEKAEEL
ncbi:MAG: AAA family ATPase [Patescibacteria group bacterium]